MGLPSAALQGGACELAGGQKDIIGISAAINERVNSPRPLKELQLGLRGNDRHSRPSTAAWPIGAVGACMSCRLRKRRNRCNAARTSLHPGEMTCSGH
jgi:hypothetical protein